MELSSRFLWILSCSLRCLVECSLNFVGHLWILHELYLWIRCEFLLQLYSQSFLFSLKFSLSCLQAFEALSRSLKFPSKFYLPFSDLTLNCSFKFSLKNSLWLLCGFFLRYFFRNSAWILVRFSLNSLGVLYQILIALTWSSSFSLVVLCVIIEFSWSFVIENCLSTFSSDSHCFFSVLLWVLFVLSWKPLWVCFEFYLTANGHSLYIICWIPLVICGSLRSFPSCSLEPLFNLSLSALFEFSLSVLGVISGSF